jgi:2-polyprenyl-6-methoxyphenol 4-hydroxylase
MTETKQFDIAIIGGGMAGCSLALLLAKKIPSLSIALIETLSLNNFSDPAKAAPLPSYDDRSSALSLGSCRIFQTLKLWDELLAYLEPIKQVHVSDRGHPAGTLMDSREIDSINGELGYVIENRHLGAVLLSNLYHTPAITVYSPATVLSVTPKTHSANLEISDSLSINTKLLVVADGAESGLRDQLGIAVDRTPYHQSAVIANVTTSAFHQYIAYERFTDTGPMALLPLQDFNGDHRCALVWTVSESFATQVTHMTDAEFLQNIQQRFGSRLGFFIKAGKRSIYPLVLHKAREQVRTHIVLMGNAAHGMHPVAGQGFNLSLRDCLALAETLQNAVTNGEAIGSLPVLQRYLDQQSWDQDKTINTSHLLTLLFSTAEPGVAFARNTGLLGLNFLPGIKNWFAKQAMGIGERAITKK